jgi:ArsR family transcriptional regulator
MCQTLANPVRLKILYLLQDGEKSVNELTNMLEIHQANVSQHLAVLREKNIVIARREGTSIHYRIANPKITQACEIIRKALFENLAKQEKIAKSILQSR